MIYQLTLSAVISAYTGHIPPISPDVFKELLDKTNHSFVFISSPMKDSRFQVYIREHKLEEYLVLDMRNEPFSNPVHDAGPRLRLYIFKGKA